MVSDWAAVRKEDVVVIDARQTRMEAGKAVLNAVNKTREGLTERAAAMNLSIPKSTLRGRISRFKMLQIDKQTYEFFTSEAGIAFAQRLTDSILLFAHEVAGFGLRLVENVLRTSGLDRFVASSASYLGHRAAGMEDLIIAFEKHEKPRLSVAMPFRFISTLEDETWLNRMHLVAMDAVSGFILVEEPAERRDGESWHRAVSRGLAGFKVKIVQVTSDEGRGLINHAESILGANHSPDLFHVQREISRGMAATLAAQIRSADKAVADEEKALAALLEEQRQSERLERGPGRPIDWAGRMAAAAQSLEVSRRNREQTVERQNRFRECVRGMSEDYHPIDVEQGTLRSPRELERRLQERFVALRSIIVEGQLPEYAAKAVDKAERVLPAMVATLSFVSAQWEQYVNSLGISSKAAWQVRARLLPAAYLARIAANKRKDTKERLLTQAVELRRLASSAGTELDSYTQEQQGALNSKCYEQILLFQRSSSPLEGRNGRLSQMHAVGRGVGKRTIRVLTILSNFLIERPDGTTAAERFFGQKPLDLIEWVFSRMPLYAASRKSILAPMTNGTEVLVH